MCLKTEDVLFLWNLEKRVHETAANKTVFEAVFPPNSTYARHSFLFSPWRNETSTIISIAVNHRVILLPLSCLSIEVAVTLVHSCDLKLEFTINVHVWKFAVRFECIRWRSGSCASTPNSLRSVTQKYHSTGHFTPSVSSFRPFMTTLVTSSSSTW